MSDIIIISIIIIMIIIIFNNHKDIMALNHTPVQRNLYSIQPVNGCLNSMKLSRNFQRSRRPFWTTSSSKKNIIRKHR